MVDQKTTISALKEKVTIFMKERDWEQFHSPKNMSMAIAAEAAELMELFLWLTESQSWDELQHNKQEIAYEVADIAIALLEFSIQAKIDLSAVIVEKLAVQEEKYPIEKAKGKTTKYTKL